VTARTQVPAIDGWFTLDPDRPALLGSRCQSCGIVCFPQHNLQMYVKSVTHDFDYQSGFSTEAELMAPAAMNKAVPGKKLSEQDVGDLPGFAIGGNVNNVGGISD